jgi:hypothetical protein
MIAAHEQSANGRAGGLHAACDWAAAPGPTLGAVSDSVRGGRRGPPSVRSLAVLMMMIIRPRPQHKTHSGQVCLGGQIFQTQQVKGPLTCVLAGVLNHTHSCAVGACITQVHCIAPAYHMRTIAEHSSLPNSTWLSHVPHTALPKLTEPRRKTVAVDEVVRPHAQRETVGSQHHGW